MKIKNLYLKFYLSALFTFFITALPALAFEISPVKGLLTVDPGTSQTMVVKIKNTPPSIPPLKGEGQGVGQGVGFKLDVFGMSQDENGKPIFEKGINLAESWVYPENTLVNIKSGETKSVNFIIKIPADAVAGSYYLGLAVEPVLEKSNQSSVNTRLVSLLTLETKGLVRESVMVEKFEPLSGITGEKYWKFNLNLKNNGTIEALMRGEMAIRDWKGEEIFSEPIVLGNKLLAGSKRALRPEIILRNNISLPGIYSAQIKINYGRTNQTVSSIAYVWYFPKWSKIVLGIIILIFIFFIFRRVKKVK